MRAKFESFSNHHLFESPKVDVPCRLHFKYHNSSFVSNYRCLTRAVRAKDGIALLRAPPEEVKPVESFSRSEIFPFLHPPMCEA